MAKNLKVTQVKSVIGATPAARKTMASLGLKKIRQSVVRPDNGCVRGQVHKVRHLVTVEEVD